MAYEYETVLEEELVENAVSSVKAVLESCLKPEIEYSTLAEYVDTDDLVREIEIEYGDLAEQVDVEALAGKVSCSSVAEHICCETVAGYVKYDAVVEMLKDELPQVDDLDELQRRQVEMWEFYMSLKSYFFSNAAVPMGADGELK